MAFASAVLLAADLGAECLPNDGWRFAIRQAFSKEPPNCLCLLVANVDPQARGLGLPEILIERAKQATHELGFGMMIAPVRPTLKHMEPLTPMDEYVRKRDAEGRPFDPWLRVHAKCGGRIANVCPESVHVRATLAKWREWTGLPLLESGSQLVTGGLAPLHADLAADVGEYVEANVWVRYEL